MLYNFLEEFLFLFDSKQFLASEIKKIKITKIDKINEDKSKYILEAEVCGDNAKNYTIVGDIKAVTYNQMFIKKEKEIFVCQVVLDM